MNHYSTIAYLTFWKPLLRLQQIYQMLLFSVYRADDTYSSPRGVYTALNQISNSSIIPNNDNIMQFYSILLLDSVTKKVKYPSG